MGDVIEVSHLKKYYRVYRKRAGLVASLTSLWRQKEEVIKAVDDISFSLSSGEIVGFIGPNGAGKTTTLKCLTGLLYPDGGRVSVLGFSPWRREKMFLRQIAFVMGQKQQLWWELPPLETFHLNKEIYEIPSSEFKKTLDELVALFEIEDLLKIPVRKLSLGQRMKCELVAALLHRPRILFLDEPTIGLDVVMQEKIRNFIKDYNRRYQATILLTSHYMEDVRRLAERVVIINKGKIIFDGEMEEIVNRFSTVKLISVVFSQPVKRKEVLSVGKIRIKEFSFPKGVFLVKRQLAPLVAAELIRCFPVADLNIEELPIEEVIRRIFTGKRVKV